MKKKWIAVVSICLLAVLLSVPIGLSPVWAADSGGYGSTSTSSSSGYGSTAPAATSSGYGSSAPAESSSSSGYGSSAPAATSSGYGSSAPAESSSSSGYGSSAPAATSSGYGSSAPAESTSSSGYGSSAPAESTSGGYGSSAPAESSSSGYGSSAPATTSTTSTSGGYGSSAPAAKTTTSTSGGYGSTPAAATATPTEEAKPEPVAAPEAPASAKKAPSNKMSLSFVLSGLLVGLLFGWILQRGRFCMNTAFRDTIFIKDLTLLRAYIIALMISIVGANLLNDYFHVLHLARQPFLPVAQIIGGYVFGMGIVISGGCGSGIWYRAGEGQIASLVAIVGFFAGIVTTVDGMLKPLNRAMMSIRIPIHGINDPGLWQIFGDGMAIKWGTIAVLVIAGFIFIQKDKPFSLGKQKGYYWSVTGVLVGLASVLAFWASEHYGGFARGISFTTPTRELFYTIFQGTSHSRFFPNKEITYFGMTVSTTWGIFFLLGVPFGAYISARGLKEFSWKTPPAKELLMVFGGGLMMGFGASTALGCNMGQGITGFSTLSIGSIAATIAILLGNWTMVYYKFIRPMGDMDLD